MAEYNRETCLAWLASAGLNPAEQKTLLAMEPDPCRLYSEWKESSEIRNSMNLSDRLRKILDMNSNTRFMDTWARLTEKNEIKAITVMDSSFPEKLRPLPQAPAVLFYTGYLEALNGRTVSIVGSRNPSVKAAEITRSISRELSNNGVRIISGLAYGIDAAAHQGCLEGDSPTIAVLGCGLDRDYPADHAALRRKIMERGGLVLSEYAPGEKPLGWHFPYRNRIISGLGDCLAVMEAKIRSGSMTTVQHALDQGKDVFVHPGDPFSPKSEGNHLLLREGAIYFTTSDDLMEDMGWLDKKNNVRQNIPCTQEDENASLTMEERLVLKRLENGEQSFDQLCDSLRFSAAQLNSILSMLQIRDLVQALPGKLFQRKNNI